MTTSSCCLRCDSTVTTPFRGKGLLLLRKGFVIVKGHLRIHHPTGYLRVFILAEMLRRMGFEGEAAKVRKVWTDLYSTARGHRIPGRLLDRSGKTIPHVVDEVAFQTRRNLAQRALADVIRFDREDEKTIRQAARWLIRGTVPGNFPPRFLVSASHYAVTQGASPRQLSDQVIKHLSGLAGDRKQLVQPIAGVKAA